MNLKPRNEWVLIRRVKVVPEDGQLDFPDSSIESVEHVVVAVGKKVEDLSPGDKVLIVGSVNQDYGFLPRSKDLLMTKEQNVTLVFDEEQEPDFIAGEGVDKAGLVLCLGNDGRVAKCSYGNRPIGISGGPFREGQPLRLGIDIIQKDVESK